MTINVDGRCVILPQINTTIKPISNIDTVFHNTYFTFSVLSPSRAP